MDSYDEVHDVKDGRDITTPDLDVSSAIKFIHSEDDKEEFERNVPEVRGFFDESSWAKLLDDNREIFGLESDGLGAI